MKLNTLCWLGLILLTLTGVMASEAMPNPVTLWIVLSAAWIKMSLVGWRFMELHSAHGLWKAGFLLMITGLVGLLCLLA